MRKKSPLKEIFSSGEFSDGFYIDNGLTDEELEKIAEEAAAADAKALVEAAQEPKATERVEDEASD